ncbi:hypothetical protein POJ06DRAFT_278051 [Lipomyces tetrasporus]|uniref:Uncharacterized protein n=1 Tax=Lipomyces tetrasporus TaxID=54092 RepID=A0AAD7QQJ6_9ASCO|nr:uncharacterized protein POJ06DRAFT_278051 [Lipomyces tetrasporus]KAJ8098027.1 hypothetical protein POJ06DRAFT_278051 [Lipomyces tetrasporus]
MSSVSHGTEADRFDYALQFVGRCPFDQRLDIVLSRLNYLRLQEAAEELFGLGVRRGFPRLEYNSLLSRATITTNPSSLNTLVHEEISCSILRQTVSKLEEHGLRYKVSSSVERGFSDESAITKRYRGSRKIVDYGMLFCEDNNSYMRTCAIIGGPMQQYSSIQDDVRLLLYGTRYQAVILVGIEERPAYNSPIVDEAVDCVRPDYGLELQLVHQGFSHTLKETPLGPYMYDNFAWGGKISNFFLEVYKRHGRSSRTEVRRHVIVEDGKRIEQRMLSLNLTIGEVAPIAQVRRSDIGSTPIEIDVDYILYCLELAISGTGYERFQVYCLHPERSA